jgi:hypothetical protein
MARIDIDNYRTDDGIDWKAYEAAEIAAGQICSRCKAGILYPLLSEWSGGERLCGSCEKMDSEKGEVSHDTDLRCPKCGFLMNVNDYDLWEIGIWEDGEHEVSCVECECEFTVTTNMSHSFDSPARKPKGAASP